METAIQRAEKINSVRTLLNQGISLDSACSGAGVSVSWYKRWDARYASGGLDGLEDLPRSGRPRMIEPNQEESAFLRRAMLRVNSGGGTSSMTMAARLPALDPNSPLRPETRAAILKRRASKHLLPVGIREAMRPSEAEIKRYRDPKSGQNDGLYAPGWLRMATDGSRLLVPGERQVWDDGSVNVGVVVPWERGYDGVNEYSKYRLSRFQLLLCVDCSRDFIVGYSYVMRNNDAYNGSDVAAALYRVWQLAGYAPHECVMEGGAWQSERALSLLAASGVRMISAKGRPNQKLVENVFNQLWSAMSYYLPAKGQIGRFRGEMTSENKDWMRCRNGSADPRDYFPELPAFLHALDLSIQALNNERPESKTYGNSEYSRAELYKAVQEKGHALPQGLRRYALPVRVKRVLARFGQVSVSAECPFGWSHNYQFQSQDGYRFDGAPVIVSFDPYDISSGAIIELAEDFRDAKRGTIIDEAAPCVSPAPVLIQTQNYWHVECLDARAAARAEKRGSRAKVGAQVAAFDERGVKARHAEHEGKEQYAFGEKAAEPAEMAVEPTVPQAETDWDALEKAAGIMVS